MHISLPLLYILPCWCCTPCAAAKSIAVKFFVSWSLRALKVHPSRVTLLCVHTIYYVRQLKLYTHVKFIKSIRCDWTRRSSRTRRFWIGPTELRRQAYVTRSRNCKSKWIITFTAKHYTDDAWWSPNNSSFMVRARFAHTHTSVVILIWLFRGRSRMKYFANVVYGILTKK